MTITNVPDTPAAASMEADKFTASFVWVSPDIAERWLARNEKNRNTAQRTVDRAALDAVSAALCPSPGDRDDSEEQK